MKLTKFLGEKAVRFSGKWGIVTLIHLMPYKPQIFTDDVLRCVFDKYVITYQNIYGKGMVRPHLVKSRYCETSGLLKGAPILRYFLPKRI